MMLCLDIGNTRSKGAVFAGDSLVARFASSSELLREASSGAEFLGQQLAAHTLAPSDIKAISICQVFGDIDQTIESSCLSLFGQRPFLLNGLTQQSLSLHYRHPERLGPDRIAAAIGALVRWPGENLIVVDCGTAVTFCCVDRLRQHLGGVITAGPELMARALGAGTGRLPAVAFNAQAPILGRCTESGIQSGLLYGSLGMIREILARLRLECFGQEALRVVATGGHAAAFEPYGLFDVLEPDLVLHGLRAAHPMNFPTQAQAGFSP